MGLLCKTFLVVQDVSEAEESFSLALPWTRGAWLAGDHGLAASSLGGCGAAMCGRPSTLLEEAGDTASPASVEHRTPEPLLSLELTWSGSCWFAQ